MGKALIPIGIILVVAVVLFLIFVGVLVTVRRIAFRKQADEIELDKRRKLAALGLLLAEKQHTWSLEDLHATRDRINRKIAALHAGQDPAGVD